MTPRGPLLPLVLLVALAAGARDAIGEAPVPPAAFVEVEARPARAFVEQPVELVVRVGVEASRLDAALVPSTSRALDVPVHVDAPLATLPGAVALSAPAVPVGARTAAIALGDDVVRAVRAADVVRDGRAFAVLEVARRVLFERAGRVALPTPTLRFSWAARFDEDLLDGRVARDVARAVVAGRAGPLEVLPLPADGRPSAFSGVVGRYALAASLDRDDVAVGGDVRLTLRFEGEGNLEARPAPALPALAGFHVFGRLDVAAGPTGRTVAWDLSPTAAVTAMPPVRVVAFDPAPPGRYVELSAGPVPLRVREGGAATAPTPTTGEGRPGAAVATTVLVALGGLLAAVGAVVAVGRRARRRRRAVPVGPSPGDVGPGVLALRRARAAAPGDRWGALARGLSAALGIAVEDLRDDRIDAEARARGCTDAEARALADAWRDAIAARWGREAAPGTEGAGDEAALRALDERAAGRPARH